MKVTSKEILTGPIGPVLVRMTIPMIIGIAVMILFQAVDTFFVSLLGTVELAAISFTFPVTYTIANLGVGFGVGISIMLARVIGRDEIEKARHISRDTLLLCLLMTSVVSVLGLLTVGPLFRLLGATDETLPFIHDYMDIWYLSVGMMIMLIVGNGILRAKGDMRLPSILLMLSSLLNAVLDPLLIFGFGPVPSMGVKGAAIATAIAWSLSFIGSIWIMRVRENILAFSAPTPWRMLKFWGELSKVSLPISITNMLNPIAAIVITALIARYGEYAVAGLGAGTRIEAIAIVACIALTSALSPYMAQNLGAGKIDRARQALRISLCFALLYQLGLYPIIVLTSPWLARIFSNDPAVIEVTKMFLWIMPAGFAFYSVLIVMNTAFNAAHQSHKTLIACLIRLFLCYAPGVWIGSHFFGIKGLFIGAVAGNGLGAFIAWNMLKRTYDVLEMHTVDKAHMDDFEIKEIDEVELKAAQVD